MIRAIFSIISLGLISLFSAQTNEFQHGEIFKPERTYHLQTLSVDNDEVYVCRVLTKGLFGKPISTKMYELDDLVPKRSKDLKIRGMNEYDLFAPYSRTGFFELNGKIWFEYLTYTNDQTSIKVAEVDMKTLSGSKLETLFNEKTNKSVRKRPGYVWARSSRNARARAYIIKRPKDKSENELITVQYYDSAFQLGWEQDIKLDIPDEDIWFSGAAVSPNGKIALVWGTGDKSVHTLKRDYQGEYWLMEVDSSGIISEGRLQSTSNQYINQLSVEYGDDDVLYGAGFYGLKIFKSDGVVAVKLDIANDEFTSHFHLFSNEFLTKNLGEAGKRRVEGRASRGKSTNLEFEHRTLIFHGNGFSLVGEIHYITEVTRRDQNGMAVASSTNYYYNDIAVMHFNYALEKSWDQRIIKVQKSVDDGGRLSSFTVAYDKNNLHFLYNGSERSFFLLARPMLIHATIDEDGNQNTEVMYDQYSKRKFIYVPKDAQFINHKTLIIPGISFSRSNTRACYGRWDF